MMRKCICGKEMKLVKKGASLPSGDEAKVDLVYCSNRRIKSYGPCPFSRAAISVRSWNKMMDGIDLARPLIQSIGLGLVK